MIIIRLVEQKLAKEKELGSIGGPVHLGVGQEAIAAGISLHLKKTDRVFGAHRSHSHIISLGTNIKNFFFRNTWAAYWLVKRNGWVYAPMG
jgi:pyruvate dehydrogenase E1 component alpha subunit